MITRPWLVGRPPLRKHVRAVPRPQIEEAESRLDIGVHYRIPYPRLHHNKPFKYTEPPAGSFGGR